MRKVFVLGSLLATSLFLLLGGAGQAQYPPPAGTVVASVGSTTPPAGTSTTLGCQVLTPGGDGIAGVECTFTIITEPGTDAAVGSKTVTRVTDANGRATTNLFVGTTPGIIVVMTSSQGLTSSIIINVQPVGQPVSQASTLPPAAPVAVEPVSPALIRPPSTGDGGLR